MTGWKFSSETEVSTEPAAKYCSCHLERGRMPESKDPCVVRAAQLRIGVSSKEKRENSLKRCGRMSKRRGPSTAQCDSQANRTAALRMTGWKFSSETEVSTEPAAKYCSCHLERGRMPESKDACVVRAAHLRIGGSSKEKRENSLKRCGSAPQLRMTSHR